jgi:phage baseplate assembly protein gpV
VVDCETITIGLVEGENKPTPLTGNIKEFSLDKEVNQHTKVYLKIVIEDDTPIETATHLEIRQQGELIFRGMIVSYQFLFESQYLTAVLEAASTTCELDVEVKRRTFQQDQMTYNELVKTILAEYPGAEYTIDDQLGKRIIGGFYLQFDETDWQFLCRMASVLNTVIVADSTAAKPRLYFEVPKPQTKATALPKTSCYHLVKNLNGYRYNAENRLISGSEERDFEVFQVEETGELLNIGDPVPYHGEQRFVYQSTVTKTGGQMIQECRLTVAGGFKQSRTYNELLRGLTIKGTVVGRSKSEKSVPPVAVQVRFTIDVVYNNKHKTKDPGIYHWFPYSAFYGAEGSTGLYCLPEIGEQVALYFPNCNELHAFVTNSVRKPGKVSITNPNIKCLRTGFGKELRFDEHGIKVVTKGGTNGGEDLVYIALQEDGNITIHSDSKVEFAAAQVLDVHAKGTVNITADDSINLTSEGCSIMLNGTTQTKALKVLKKQVAAGKKINNKLTKTQTGIGGGPVVVEGVNNNKA